MATDTDTPDPGPFYFAWCDVGELTTFGPEHYRQDEEVYSLAVSQVEGEFPSAVVEIRNPRVGMLGPGRKRWAWISWREDEDTVHPLMFGRIVGAPEQIQNDAIQITLVARPADYETQLTALADSLRVLPHYDPLWFDEDERLDPNRVLEGYTRLWHIDRVTHAVTASDVLEGEDGTITFDAATALYDSVDVSYETTPATRIDVTAAVQWDEAGAGEIDATPALQLAFNGVTPATETWFNGLEKPSSKRLISIVDGASMIEAWPEDGASIGGGWSVGRTTIGPLLTRPGGAVLMTPTEYAYANTRPENILPGTFSSGGFVLQILGPVVNGSAGEVSGEYDILWIPLWRLTASMTLAWNIKRARKESLVFSIGAGVQPLLAEPGGEDVIQLNLGPVSVDARIGDEAPLSDVRSQTYFKTPRGQQSFEHILCRARAALAIRARAVIVKFQVPFAAALGLSCRKNATLVDPRLPGGSVTGKVTGYSLSVDGDSGRVIGAVTLGCAVGYGGEFVPAGGEPSYVEAGYVETGYQVYTGQTVALPGSSAVFGWTDFSDAPIETDGIDLTNITARDYITSVVVTGGQESQEQEIAPTVYNKYGSVREVVDRLSAVTTTVTLDMKPLTGGPFETVIAPVVSDLIVPQQIDLEAA